MVRRRRRGFDVRALTRSPDGTRSRSVSPARARRRDRRDDVVVEIERGPRNSLDRQLAGRAAYLRDSPPNAEARDPIHRVPDPAARPRGGPRPEDQVAHVQRHWQGNITFTLDRVRDTNQRLAFFYEMLLSSETVRDLIRDYLRRARRHGLTGNV